MRMTKKSLATNPVRRFRCNAALSQLAFSKKCMPKISTQALYMTENGVYENIPEGIKNYMISRDVDWDSIVVAYQKFRLEVAANNAASIAGTKWIFPPPDRTKNPVKEFRMYSLSKNPSATCMHFLINPGIYKRLEETLDYARIPETIIKAFIAGGLPKDVVDELEERYKDFSDFSRYK